MNMTKEEKLYFDRLSDCSLRLETIHKLRWIILENLGNSNNVSLSTSLKFSLAST